MVGIDDVAFAIELNLAKKSSKFKDSEEGSWLPFNNYAKRYIDKFGDSEPPLWEWFCFLLKEYEGLDKDVKRQGLKEGDESRFAKWRGEVEDHTTFYGFLGKVIISIAIILIIIFEPEILKLFPLSP